MLLVGVAVKDLEHQKLVFFANSVGSRDRTRISSFHRHASTHACIYMYMLGYILKDIQKIMVVVFITAWKK